jgi:hypothetical protein
MKRFKGLTWLLAPSLVLTVSVLAVSLLAQDAKPTAPAAPVKWAPKEEASAPTAKVAARRELTLRQRREMGLTLSNLAEIAKELKAEGEIDKDTPHAEGAALIASRLESKSPKSFAGSSAFDWQAILDLIERLMPFIMRLIDLFSFAPPGGVLILPA